MADELSLGDRKAVQTELERRKETASFIGWVDKKEDKGKKERRILVIGKNRLLSIRPGGKVARDPHWLELVEMRSSSPTDLILGFRNFRLEITSGAVDEIITCLREAFDASFPGVPQSLKFKLDVQPASRLKAIAAPDQPLGGFIPTYRSVCDFYGIEEREDIVWDMENLFIPGRIKDFNLKEFEEPIGFSEVRTLLGALQYNSYFKSLIIKHIPLDKNMIQSVGECLKFNTALDELVLSSTGINKDGMAVIAEGLSFNKTLALTSITLSHNSLEDKGAVALAQYLGSLNRGLVRLDVSHCTIGKSGMAALGNALKKNAHMSSTLTFFDISHNKLEAEGSAALAAFLANPNVLRSLLLSNCYAVLEVILGAVVRGCNELTTLDVANNKLSRKESAPLCRFLQASAGLQRLQLAGTGAPVELVKDVVTALSANHYLTNVRLSLADNKLGVPGARVLAGLVDKLAAVTSLNLAENDFGDDGVSIVAEALCYNSHLKHLSLKGNFKSRSKTRNHTIDSLIALLNSECPLETLNISGSPKAELKTDIIPFLYALGTNETLLSLDVGGNQMGNKGASALGKALQTNETLQSLFWDNNLTSLAGFQAFYVGLKRNFSLKQMPLPISDVSGALKGSEQPLSDLTAKIQSLVLRNQNPANKFQSNENPQLGGKSNSFAFLSSGNREEVQKVLYKIKSTGKKITDPAATVVIEDAEQQDQLMTSLYSIDDQIHQTFEHELKKELVSFVKKVAPIYPRLKNTMIQQVMETVKKGYKSLPPETVKRLQTNLAFGGKDLSEEEWERTLVDAAGSELGTKAGQAFHSTLNIASDYLYEKIQDELQEILYSLTEASHTSEDLKAKPSSPAIKSPKPKETKAPPVKKVAPPVRRDAKPKGDEVRVESLPKVEANLEHVTRGRPQQQKRRPPTRKPRPAPPSSGTSM